MRSERNHPTVLDDLSNHCHDWSSILEEIILQYKITHRTQCDNEITVLERIILLTNEVKPTEFKPSVDACKMSLHNRSRNIRWQNDSGSSSHIII